ncbi:TetR/AcrR family transcriptional regulator [Cytobacillus dafuensis]|uniref:TetR/AcrR family transcriptional regulator n=1 Tax=Cytobacillus dafuensis TaxID=1742359 RepID=A0A5B8Z8B2_CYTDA|nr:TetR/AcrR family transcriptional regulator [Cytobacillus dafuensis]QED49332.1 TetR/AcrR family transcriptional regulator [Cytobacillus dafuensis]
MNLRGRKKGANGQESRALLLKIAADEFAHHGFHGTKISSIVKKAQLTQPTFYLYFESKEAIYQELVDLFHEKLSFLTKKSRLEEGLDSHSLPIQIKHGLANILTFFMENQSLTRIGFFISPQSEVIKKQMAKQIEENLLSEVEKGYFNPNIDMSMVSEGLIGVIERLTLTKLFQGEKEPEALAREIVFLFLYGMNVPREC